MSINNQHKSAQKKTAKTSNNHALPRNLLNIYGRNAVLAALNSKLDVFRLHLSTSNKTAPVLEQIIAMATAKNVEIHYHDKRALSFISKNSKQDQGVAADISCPRHAHFEDWLQQIQQNSPQQQLRVLALDSIHNPQNLGMAIRSATAAGIDAILIAPQGTSSLNPLVVKASAGSIFNAPIVHCKILAEALAQLLDRNFELALLDAKATTNALQFTTDKHICFAVGNETSGLSDRVKHLPHTALSLPLFNNIESLNVAVSAALICYQPHFFEP